ncbi:MAG: ATP-grasp domain-containing protein [Cycloclasticus sp.]|nr:ATP-grasp domain-containing protein [Cycloclasticus sp.]
MIKRILIANRGEIACRIARTCRRLGIAVVGIYSEADKNSRHVREIGRAILVGGPLASDSYLNIQSVINAAKNAACDAIHPGYGFLSENPEFADAVESAGLIFIGPRADSLRRFGDKSAAKKEAVNANVNVIPGSEQKLTDPQAIAACVKGMQLPVMLKAAAGGGGKGMRVLNDLNNLESDIASAMSEALRAFSDDAILIEQCITNARHVEVQIAGDGDGNVVHLFERECSLQRRHQKVIEEAPAIFLTPELRDSLLSAACRLGAQIQYRGLGTVEFLVVGKDYYFLEVNPRLQVEHPVTEGITGIDLVELQIRIADGVGFGFNQQDISVNGHAIEVRLYAESPTQQFMPSTGVIDSIEFPSQLRIETGVDSGDTVSSYYDPMIAKLIATGASRAQALERLQLGLAETVIFGLDNNRHFLRQLLLYDEVQADRIDTGTIDRWLPDYAEILEPQLAKKQAAVAAALWLDQHRDMASKNPWKRTAVFTQWSLNSIADTPLHTLVLKHNDNEWNIAFLSMDAHLLVSLTINDERFDLTLQQTSNNVYLAEFEDSQLPITAVAYSDVIYTQSNSQQITFEVLPVVSDKQGESDANNNVIAPMMGEIINVLVEVGETVEAGQLLIVMESMKMQLQIVAVSSGIISTIHCKAGDNVARGAVVVDVDAE